MHTYVFEICLGGVGSEMRIIDLSTHTVVHKIAHPDRVRSVAWDATGTHIYPHATTQVYTRIHTYGHRVFFLQCPERQTENL